MPEKIVGTITISDNTSVSAQYLPFHVQCRMEPCKWGSNFSERLDAERVGLRHQCKGEHMRDKTMTQLISDQADEKYQAWAKQYEEGVGTPAEKYTRGVLQGLCIALAILRNPYYPDPTEVAKAIQKRGDKKASDG